MIKTIAHYIQWLSLGCPDLLPLLTKVENKYKNCPASTSTDFYSAFPGGLCYHTLKVLSFMKKLNDTLCQGSLTMQSMLRVGILSEIGRIGDDEHDYYIMTTEKWKLQKGILYDVNEEIQYMRLPHRSLFWVNKFGIKLTKDEQLAILLLDQTADNMLYKYKEPDLAVVLQQATYWAQRVENKNQVELKF